MGRLWLRAIDSAQRQITIERPLSPSNAHLTRVRFDIQGVLIEFENGSERVFFADMADEGVRSKGEAALTFWQRLLRRDAKIGEIRSQEQGQILVSYWAKPELQLLFDLEDVQQANLWRECEIMALSAGFHFRHTDSA